MIPIVQREVNTFVDVVWNSHRIREQKNTFLPDGVPNHIYSFPEKHANIDLLFSTLVANETVNLNISLELNQWVKIP